MAWPAPVRAGRQNPQRGNGSSPDLLVTWSGCRCRVWAPCPAVGSLDCCSTEWNFRQLSSLSARFSNVPGAHDPAILWGLAECVGSKRVPNSQGTGRMWMVTLPLHPRKPGSTEV